MSTPKLKTVVLSSVHDEAALIRLGAWRIGEVRDKKGNLTGQEVEPAIDMKGYAAALAEVEAERGRAKLSEVRRERNRRLVESDWTQVSDAPLSEKQRAAWAAYRQALRDLPAASGEPAWPKPPSD